MRDFYFGIEKKSFDKGIEKKILTNTKTKNEIGIYHKHMWIKIDRFFEFFSKPTLSLLSRYFDFVTVMLI